MITVDFQKLFEPYTKDGATLEGTRKWLIRKAAQLNIAEQIADQAISETMLELAGGKAFFDDCPCCGPGEVHNAIEHYMRDKMFFLHQQANKLMVDFLQNSLNAAIIAYFTRNIKPGRFAKLKAWLKTFYKMES
jgi:uncharacterized protein (DUF2267 family)